MLLHSIMELGKYIHFVGFMCVHLIPIHAHMYMYPHTHVLLADVIVCEGEVSTSSASGCCGYTDHQLGDYLLRLIISTSERKYMVCGLSLSLSLSLPLTCTPHVQCTFPLWSLMLGQWTGPTPKYLYTCNHQPTAFLWGT